MRSTSAPWADRPSTARLVLADGTMIAGMGLGATGSAVGEVCFNTAITGYQEILTDPSYAGQIITFTFPHIGNVGTNVEDTETSNLASRSGVRGCVLRADVTAPSSYRSADHLDNWLKSRGIIAITGIDTRALTARIREKGMPNGVIAHDPAGKFDFDKLKAEAKAWPGLDGMDLVPEVTAGQSYTWDEMSWVWNKGYPRQESPEFHVVAIDFGLKRNILQVSGERGLQGDRGAGDNERCGGAGAQARRRVPVEWTRRSGGDREIRGPRDQEAGQVGATGVRHLPRPSVARHRPRREDAEDASGPSWREPSGQGSHDRQGRDYVDEPRLHSRSRHASQGRRGDPHLLVRSNQLRHSPQEQAGVLGAVSSRGESRDRRTATICSCGSST